MTHTAPTDLTISNADAIRDQLISNPEGVGTVTAIDIAGLQLVISALKSGAAIAPEVLSQSAVTDLCTHIGLSLVADATGSATPETCHPGSKE